MENQQRAQCNPTLSPWVKITGRSFYGEFYASPADWALTGWEFVNVYLPSAEWRSSHLEIKFITCFQASFVLVITHFGRCRWLTSSDGWMICKDDDHPHDEQCWGRMGRGEGLCYAFEYPCWTTIDDLESGGFNGVTGSSDEGSSPNKPISHHPDMWQKVRRINT
jgi:hypothetical protein